MNESYPPGQTPPQQHKIQDPQFLTDLAKECGNRAVASDNPQWKRSYWQLHCACIDLRTMIQMSTVDEAIQTGGQPPSQSASRIVPARQVPRVLR